MTDEEKSLLRRKWEYTNEFKTFGNVMGKMEGFGVLDLRTDGVLILRDNIAEFKNTFGFRARRVAGGVTVMHFEFPTLLMHQRCRQLPMTDRQ